MRSKRPGSLASEPIEAPALAGAILRSLVRCNERYAAARESRGMLGDDPSNVKGWGMTGIRM